MARALGAALAGALLLAGCGQPDGAPREEPTGQDQPPAPTSTTSTGALPTPSAAPTPTPAPAPGDDGFSTWPLATRVLPLRADGYGEVRPTPPSLRERRYRTTDLLPPPSGDRFAATVDPVSAAVRRRMGRTWAPSCPVPLSALRYLTVTFRGFDGATHTGEIVVAATEARGVVSVFRTLYAADFPIEEMRLPTTADLDAPPTGDGNNTAGYVCRPTTGQSTVLSAHAYGQAIDLDPFQNPYLRDDVVLPERASSYLDRDDVRPGMVEPDDVVVRAFAAIGWSWGGDFETLKDYQHFTGTGR